MEFVYLNHLLNWISMLLSGGLFVCAKRETGEIR